MQGLVLLCCCVCLILAIASVHAAEYRFIGRYSTPGNEVLCGQKDDKGNPQPFCKICNGVTALADACDNNPKCKGFDMEDGYCGHLKGAAGKGKAVYTEGFSHYFKIGSGSICEGPYTVKIRAETVGNDINCNAKNYNGEPLSVCNVEGYPIQVGAACSANPKCKAFTTSDGYGGYLKATAGPTTYTEKSVTYAKA